MMKISLTDRERALVSMLVGAPQLSVPDVEHLIARDDLMRVGEQFAGALVSTLDHVKSHIVPLTPSQLAVLKTALTLPGQTTDAWRLSAGIARKLPTPHASGKPE